MNTEILREVQKLILENHPKFDMGSWSDGGDCGTAMCIAGWIAHIHGHDTKSGIPEAAMEALGLDGRGHFFPLFHETAWPQHLKDQYLYAETSLDEANAGCGAIESFINFVEAGGDPHNWGWE